MSETTVDALCEVMHDAYEAAAVEAGWETQERSRKPWADVPEANKATMRAAVRAMLESPHVEAMLDRARAEASAAPFRCETHLCGACGGCKAAKVTDRLTEVEAERDRLAGEVEALRARLAAMEALAARWVAADGEPATCCDLTAMNISNGHGHRLRAALEVTPDA